MSATVTPAEVRTPSILREEIALLDVREEFHFAHAHPLFAANLSLSQLELDIGRRVPRRDTPVVVYDNGEGFAEIAAARMGALGYTRVRRLQGGLQGWADAGYELFQDVNSYSKAFGELVEARRHTPSLPAQELQARLNRREDLVVLDARRFDEYQTMSIPTGVSVPGAELVLRARTLAPDPSTTIIVNCAGRTRSLIGAQSLINAGVPNPVYALRNGTIGWTLAGQTLDHGQGHRAPRPSPERAAKAAAQSREVSYRAGVRHISPTDLTHLAADARRTLYRFDVRSPEEFEAWRPNGFLSAPGGQLVQETDMFAPVRGARIVLFDDFGARADMTASWLAQMGWDVFVLDGLPLEDTAHAPVPEPAAPDVGTVTTDALDALLRDDAVTLIDLGPSPAYRRGHIPGAAFAIRSRLPEALSAVRDRGLGDRPVVLTAPDVRLARFAAADVAAVTGVAPRVLDGGTPAWTRKP